MPGTIAEDLELIHSGHGRPPSPPGGGEDDGDGGSGGGLPGTPRRAYFTAITLALAAIVMFFMALVSAYIVRKGLGTDWQQIALPRILWLNTAVLLLSSLTIERAQRKLGASGQEAFRRWWGLTTLLGIVFLAGQLVAWRELAAAGVFLAGNPASSFFYLMTAAHSVHLLGGIIALLYVAFRAWQRNTITQATAAELTAIYWHFMDGLWVFLFVLLKLGR